MWGLRTWIRDYADWVQILALKLTSCMALVKFLNPMIPLSVFGKMMTITHIYLRGLYENEMS